MKQWLLVPLCGLLVSCSLLGPVKDPCKSEWLGTIDGEFYKKVKTDIKAATDAKCQVLSVELMSPGGPVFDALAVLHEIRNAKKQMVIEFHARGVIASAATFVLGMGSKGHRYVAENTLVLLHGLQQGSMMGRECVDAKPDPETENEKVIQAMFKLMAAEYVRATGRSMKEVSHWLWCGNEQAGGGELLVQLQLADHTE